MSKWVIQLGRLTLKLISLHLLLPLKRLLKYLWSHRRKILGFFGFLIPLSITLYYLFIPKPTITFSEPLSSRNAFTSVFTINNNSNSTIYNVKLEFKFGRSSIEKKGGGRLIMGNTIWKYDYPFNKVLKNKSQSFSFDFLKYYKHDPSKSFTPHVELTINLYYEYWHYFKEVDSFKFETSEVINNHIIWMNNQ